MYYGVHYTSTDCCYMISYISYVHDACMCLPYILFVLRTPQDVYLCAEGVPRWTLLRTTQLLQLLLSCCCNPTRLLRSSKTTAERGESKLSNKNTLLTDRHSIIGDNFTQSCGDQRARRRRDLKLALYLLYLYNILYIYIHK